MVSDNDSDDDSIGAPQVLKGEPLGDNGPPTIPIPPELYPQISS